MRALLLIALAIVGMQAAPAVEGLYGEEITSLSVVNESPMPLHVDVERSDNHIFIGPSARFRDSVLVPPNGDFALRIPRGRWMVYGDGSSYLAFQVHRGGDYKLHLVPVQEGHHRPAIAGVLSDSHLGQHSEILIRDVRNPAAFEPPPGQPWLVDPRHSPIYGDDPNYRRHHSPGAQAGEQLAHALTNALAHAFHIDNNPPPPPPPYDPYAGYPVPVIDQGQPVPVIIQNQPVPVIPQIPQIPQIQQGW